MTTDDRTETITDRAAIRDSDEPSERGDFPYYDLGPATSETVGALNLDAMHETICDKFTGMDEVRQAADALVAEVRSLRAKLAAVEAVADALTMAAKIERGHGLAYAGGLIEAVQADLRAALATGEGE